MNNLIKTNKVPMSQKIAFGFGMLANQMFPAILGIFMVVLVEDLGFSGWMWSLVFLFPRIFDAFLDPIMGLFQITQNQNGDDDDNMSWLADYLWGLPIFLCGNFTKLME